jgi:hypothetical protein
MAQVTNARAIRDVEVIAYGGSPHYEARSWTAAGVECQRDRHRYTGQGYAFGIEILHLRYLGRGSSAWEVMIVTERWSTGMPETVVRSQKWMKLVLGQASSVRAWIRRYRPAGIPDSEVEEPESASLDI